MFLIFRRIHPKGHPGLLSFTKEEYQHMRARRLDFRGKGVSKKSQHPSFEIHVGDGHSRRWSASLQAKAKHANQIQVDLDSVSKHQEPVRLLCLSLPERQRFEKSHFLSAAVELGMTHLQPIICEYSVRASLSRSRLDRIQKIFYEAAAQSERYFLPRILRNKNLSQLNRVLSSIKLPSSHTLILHPPERSSYADITLSMNEYLKGLGTIRNQSLALVVGPEGGFSSREISFFRGNNYPIVHLSPNILRVSTAGLAGLANILP